MTDQNPRPLDSSDSDFTNQWPLELSEYLNFDDDQWPEDDPTEAIVSGYVLNQQDNQIQANEVVGDIGGSAGSHLEGSSSRNVSSEQEKKEVREKVAIRTKSEVEIMDDGFRWRKYGKKMVKNSLNPRFTTHGAVDYLQFRGQRDHFMNNLKDNPAIFYYVVLHLQTKFNSY